MSRQRSDETIKTAELVTIGELVRLTGVRYSTIKFYTEEGMLPYEQEEEKMTRRYRREETVSRLEWIRQLRRDGESIEMVKEKLKKQGQS